ncbi:MAG: protein kinase [Gemmatimonadota bacterium]
MTSLQAHIAEALRDRYRIQGLAGEGGMATVYQAIDVKHDRKVALKVLRPDLAAVIGADRFLAEIRTTANLQHPHILPLHDSGEVAGTVFFVMPFVEGESLRDRLDRETQLPVEEAVQIATEVADALDYAHRHGVVHRDVKPENILLHDGRALVADFGIALAVSESGGSRLTETGMSLGTPVYMSPEQGMGERTITARSDVYALGCVLYEMLLGEPPFSGSTAQAILAKLLTEKPAPLRARRERVPVQVEAAVLRALEKLPADRFGTAAEFAAALASTDPVPIQAKPTSPRTRSLSWGTVAATAIVFTGAGYLLGTLASSSTDSPSVGAGRSTHLTWEPGLEVMPAISPDGQQVAYASGTVARMRIFVRQVAGGRAIPLTDDTAMVQSHPEWSRDGARILVVGDGRVFSAPGAGGSARQEVPDGRGPVMSATWSPDQSEIAFAVADTVFVRRADGTVGALATMTEPAACSWGPRDLIACVTGNVWYMTVGTNYGNQSPSRIVVLRRSDGAMFFEADSVAVNQSPTWSADGAWLVFVSNRLGPSDLYALRVGEGGEIAGDPVRVTTGLGAQSFSLSDDGTRLAYSDSRGRANVWSLQLPADPPVSGDGAVQLTFGGQMTESPSVSLDGQWLFFNSDLAGNADIYRMRLPDGVPEQVDDDPADDFAPDLSPDGREVAFHSWRGGSRDVYIKPLDGGPLVRLTDGPSQDATPSWSPDGNRMLFQHFDGGIWIARRSSSNEWQVEERLATGFWPAWSPDGRSIVYSTGLFGGVLMAMPVDSGPSVRLMDGTQPDSPLAERPFWSEDGRTVYFNSHDAQGNASIWSIPATGGMPRLLVRFDDPVRVNNRTEWRYRNGRAYFVLSEWESDVWVMEMVPR